MKAVVKGDGKYKQPELQEVPIPKPGKGQVLLRVEAAPVSPVDILIATRTIYDLEGDIAGGEGSGTIVEIGEGVPNTLLNKQAAFLINFYKKDMGSWAQYYLINLADRNHIIYDKPADYKLIAGGYSNPFTAIGLLESAVEKGHKAIVLDAAASSLGKIFISLAKQRGVPVIAIIRRPDQVEELKQRGATHVLNSTSPYFDEELKKAAAELNATILLDCIGGEFIQRVLDLMPENSQVINYSSLTGKPVPESIKNSEGYLRFDVFKWAESLPQAELDKFHELVKNDISEGGNTFGIIVAKEYPLKDWKLAVEESPMLASEGKAVIRPQL